MLQGWKRNTKNNKQEILIIWRVRHSPYTVCISFVYLAVYLALILKPAEIWTFSGRAAQKMHSFTAKSRSLL